MKQPRLEDVGARLELSGTGRVWRGTGDSRTAPFATDRSRARREPGCASERARPGAASPLLRDSFPGNPIVHIE